MRWSNMTRRKSSNGRDAQNGLLRWWPGTGDSDRVGDLFCTVTSIERGVTEGEDASIGGGRRNGPVVISVSFPDEPVPSSGLWRPLPGMWV
jgi:hypothetical protein